MRVAWVAAFLFCAAAARAAVPEPAVYLAELVAAMDVPWPKNRTLTIVCHGHSVPAGYFKTPVVDTFNAYPHLLHAALKKDHPHAVINLIVTAIGGEDSVSGERRFDRDVLALRPDVVLIDYGLNDRRAGLEPAHAAWTAMINRAQAAGAKVLLLTPTLDLAAKLDNPDDPLLQHAAQIRALAETHGAGLVDSLTAFTAAIRAGVDPRSLMAQGNHPNRAGHDLVLQALLPWFAPRR